MKAKKSLGQNFLKSRATLAVILRSAEVAEGDTVLEIGPGKGILTEELLCAVGTNGKVVAVEKDFRMIGFLKEKFAEDIKNKKLILIQNDILNFDIKNHIPHPIKYTLVANIPYYITGQIFKKFLQTEKQPKRIVLMVQKEVAKRIVAHDKKESILSISVKVFGTPKYIQTVPARYFSPIPTVDSAILLIENIHNPFLSDGNIASSASRSSLEASTLFASRLDLGAKDVCVNKQKNLKREEGLFFEILKKGFSNKRKLLKNNLVCGDMFLKKCGISPLVRAENLSVENWLCVLQKMLSQTKFETSRNNRKL